MASRDTDNLIPEARNHFVGAIRGMGEITGAIADAVSNTVVHMLKGTRAVGAELLGLVLGTVTGTVQGVAEVGGEVGSAARSIMIGTLHGTQTVGKAGVETVTLTAADVVAFPAASVATAVSETAPS